MPMARDHSLFAYSLAQEGWLSRALERLLGITFSSRVRAQLDMPGHIPSRKTSHDVDGKVGLTVFDVLWPIKISLYSHQPRTSWLLLLYLHRSKLQISGVIHTQDIRGGSHSLACSKIGSAERQKVDLTITTNCSSSSSRSSRLLLSSQLQRLF